MPPPRWRKCSRFAFGRVHHQHVGARKLFGGRETNRAVATRAAPVQHRLPLGEKPRPIVLAGTVGFGAGAKENAKRFLGLAQEKRAGHQPEQDPKQL
jgi:hypothetical protein